MKKVSLIVALAMTMLMLFSVAAFAAQNIDTVTKLAVETPKVTGGLTGGSTLYPNGIYLTGKNFGDYPNAAGLNVTPGANNDNIHSDYNRNTDACAACHATHTAVGEALLQWDGIEATCRACHDGTITETYNVAGGFISGIAGTRTMGGLFDGIGASASLHNTNSKLLLASAPGGNIYANTTTDALWGGGFDCVSCHEPHGRADNFRILNPDVASVGSAQATEAIPVGTTTFTAAKGTWLVGYPKDYTIYTAKSVDAAGKVTYTKVDPVATPYTVDISAGKITFAAATTVAISVDYYPGLKVDGNVTNKLKATEVAKYGANMNAFCGACHTDYNTTKVIAFTNGSITYYDSKATPKAWKTVNYVKGDDLTAYSHASSMVTSGTYTGAKRHKVGRSYSGAPAHKDLTFGKFSDGTQTDFTCLTCHAAHGVDKGWWTDWSTGKVGNVGSAWAGTVSEEMAGSSALKRLPNMSTCESCHTKGVGNYNY